MREIKGPLEKLMSCEISSLGNREDYLRVTLTDEDEIIDPMGRIRSVYPNVMALDFENSRTAVDLTSITPDPGKVEHISPYELFSEFFLEASGAVMSNEQERIVRALLETGEDEI
jgi:exonuclease SbcD